VKDISNKTGQVKAVKTAENKPLFKNYLDRTFVSYSLDSSSTEAGR
jgi:hypothetical protein